MNKHPAQVTVASTAGGTQLVDPNGGRASIVIQNAGTVRVYLDKDSNVSAATSIYLDAGQTLTDKESKDAWFGLAASGTGDIRVVEVF